MVWQIIGAILVTQPVEDRQKLQKTARLAVKQQQGNRVLSFRIHGNEVNVKVTEVILDAHMKVVEGIHVGLMLMPGEICTHRPHPVHQTDKVVVLLGTYLIVLTGRH